METILNVDSIGLFVILIGIIFLIWLYYKVKTYVISTQENQNDVIHDFDIAPSAMRKHELIAYLKRDDIPSKMREFAEERFAKYFKNNRYHR